MCRLWQYHNCWGCRKTKKNENQAGYTNIWLIFVLTLFEGSGLLLLLLCYFAILLFWCSPSWHWFYIVSYLNSNWNQNPEFIKQSFKSKAKVWVVYSHFSEGKLIHTRTLWFDFVSTPLSWSSETYLGPYKTSICWSNFAKLGNDFQEITIFPKKIHLRCLIGSISHCRLPISNSCS